MTRILLVEDDPDLRALVANNLAYEGFAVVAFGNGNQALESHRTQPAELVVLDLMLPGLDGFQILKTLREAEDKVPVLLLTARSAEEDRVRGLQEGADDYVVKPFSMVELVARIHAILRRTKVPRSLVLQSGPFQIHLLQNQVYLHGQSLGLTPTEFRLLEALVANPCVPLSRKELITVLWGSSQSSNERTLNVHVGNLRRRLADSGPGEWIITVGRAGRGGYQWAAPVEPVVKPSLSGSR